MKILRIAVSQNVGALNPQGYAQNQMYAQNMVYEGLVKIDSKGNIIPSLATSWDIDKTGRIYTFTLRKNVKFSNQEPFDAIAAKKNFDSILLNRVRHSWSNLALLIEKVEILNPYQIQIILKQPYAPTLAELSLIRPFRFIAPSMIPNNLDLVNNNPMQPIGTGPYILTRSDLGKGDTFTKNVDYWNAEAYHGIYFDVIQTKIIVEPNAKIIALKTGAIDMIYGDDEIPIEIFRQITKTKEFHTYQSPAIFTTALVLNPANKILQSLSMRKAIALSIDKDSLIRAVYGYLQQKADYLFAPNRPDSDITKEYNDILPFDSNQAKRIIQDLGYKEKQDGFYYKDNQKLSLTLLYVGNNPVQKAIAEILQYQLKQVGIFLQLIPSEQTIYHNKQRTGNFDICFHETWGIPYEPLIMLNSMRYVGHVDFIAQKPLKEKPQIDKEIESVLMLPQHSVAKPLHALLHKIYATRIYIPLTYQTNKAIATKDIRGINMDMRAIEIPFWEFYKEH
ncbi:nickel ABC transporter, nickel/metallophore periplasmic binding protein [Helicobacter aurati]|uniref:Nickel ABC transporter, nickel/metallophore periplasmic binding protein n=1 Tax=Helicobacter aurati TaxID=137778 RepID=A0A3D8IZJ4_9HELI|nr:nickel ABC transporter substrate-binding protein [Helicobacter aurati]RDU70325.1 nickel ABC transporter, nickel/metallophore periplasmic binding protein [Helicobacter aurati]